MTVTVAGSETATEPPSVIEQPLETIVDYSALQHIMPFLSCSGDSLQQEQWAYKIVLWTISTVKLLFSRFQGKSEYPGHLAAHSI